MRLISLKHRHPRMVTLPNGNRTVRVVDSNGVPVLGGTFTISDVRSYPIIDPSRRSLANINTI